MIATWNNMQVRAIREFSVFDVTHSKAVTTLSMRIDGVSIYSMQVDGLMTLSSGANTIGAFRDDKAGSLFAWIDPVNGEFVQIYELGTVHPVFFAPPVLVLLAVTVGKYVGVPGLFPLMPALLISMLVSAMMFAINRRKRGSALEKVLRTALSTR